MADKNEVLGHNFDGIEEFDNDLPPWWLYLFYITIGVAVIYFPYYHIFNIGPNQHEQYALEMKALDEVAQKQKTPGTESEAPLVVYKDEVNLKKGSEIFATNCLACHGANGEGGVGPNMTDRYWIHGPLFADLVRTITKGVPEKGMVTWGGVLKPEEIRQVASYIISLQGSNPQNPKEPQGPEYEASLIGQ